MLKISATKLQVKRVSKEECNEEREFYSYTFDKVATTRN